MKDERMNPLEAAPAGYQAMLDFQRYVDGTSLEPSLVELAKIRASQINGCAFCLAMHTHEARAQGETDVRMHLVAAWEEAGVFSEREQAALAWTEAVTRIADGGVPDAVYARALAALGERGLAELTHVVNAINAWNRLSVAFRRPPLAQYLK